MLRGGFQQGDGGFPYMFPKVPPDPSVADGILKASPLRIPDGNQPTNLQRISNSSGGANVCGCRTVERTDLGKIRVMKCFDLGVKKGWKDIQI